MTITINLVIPFFSHTKREDNLYYIIFHSVCQWKMYFQGSIPYNLMFTLHLTTQWNTLLDFRIPRNHVSLCSYKVPSAIEIGKELLPTVQLLK